MKTIIEFNPLTRKEKKEFKEIYFQLLRENNLLLIGYTNRYDKLIINDCFERVGPHLKLTWSSHIIAYLENITTEVIDCLSKILDYAKKMINNETNDYKDLSFDELNYNEKIIMAALEVLSGLNIQSNNNIVHNQSEKRIRIYYPTLIDFSILDDLKKTKKQLRFKSKIINWVKSHIIDNILDNIIIWIILVIYGFLFINR